MHVISAALAFAIIMLTLSMVVSALVETIHRIIGMRERGLYYMLGQLYDHVLKHYDTPAGARAVGELGDVRAEDRANAAERRRFQEQMSENRAPVAVTGAAGTARIYSPQFDWNWLRTSSWGEIGQWLGGFWRGRGLSSLTCVAFMERLGAHPLGEQIVEKAKSRVADGSTPTPLPIPVDAVLQDIAQKFEAYAGEASIFFERRARTLSIAVAIAVAILLHVHAVDIFQTFMRDPAVAEAVIAQKELVKAYEAKIEAEKKKHASQPPVAPNPAALDAFQKAAKQLETLKTEYDDAVARLKSVESQLSGLGVPIGWTEERKRAAALWPERQRDVCEPAGKPPRDVKSDEKCVAGEKRGKRIGLGFPTDAWVLLSLLLGGLLVGLGGPFWYDIVTSLTNIRNIARGQQAPASASATPVPGTAPPGAGGAAETPQPRTPVDAFKAAQAGWIAAGRPMRR